MRRALLGILLLASIARPASAATALFSLSIGHNGIPDQRRASDLGELKFADDDALAVHELARAIARRSVVMAIPDRATQDRFASSREARPPSVDELRRVLVELGDAIQQAKRAGDEVSAAAAPALAASGTVTQVEYNASSGNNPILMIQLNGNDNVNYHAQQVSPGCGVPAHSIETIKILLSIAQAALLSGRKTVIYSVKCNDLEYFYDIVMSK